MNRDLIAPCGINCALCMAYQRDKNHCDGCNNETKAHHCAVCIIKNCDNIKKSKTKLCYECDKFPCKRIKSLDKRYRTKYNASMIDNLNYIKENGVSKFITKEEEKWTCKNCGSLMCMHRNICFNCKEVSIKS